MPPPTQRPAPASDPAEVPAYYASKTAAIFHKYGPGPRIHFHLGMYDPTQPPATAVAQRIIQRNLVSAQEALLGHAAHAWEVDTTPPATLLDIGCGLGGGSLYWAQEHGARVTGLTIAADHVPLIRELARRVGCEHQVHARHGDVHDFVPDGRRYHAAVAIESSGYMDRPRLFQVVARGLRSGGWFGIEEHFLRCPDYAPVIDDYYKTRLGTLAEYAQAAGAAGFELEHQEDITDRVAEFWVQSMAWTTLELDAVGGLAQLPPIAVERLERSALMHSTLFRLWREHVAETWMLRFRLRGDPA